MTTSQFAAMGAAILFFSAVNSVQAQSAGAPATAEPVTPAAAHSASKTRDPNQMICKREQMTGSMLGGKPTCHTRADWEQMSRDSAAAVTRMRPAGGPTSMGSPH